MSMFFNHSLMMMTMRMRMMVMILGMVMIMMMIMITMMIMMSMVNRMVIIIIIIMVGHVSTENIFDMIFSKLYVKIIKIKKKINNNLILTNDKIQ